MERCGSLAALRDEEGAREGLKEATVWLGLGHGPTLVVVRPGTVKQDGSGLQ